VRALVTWMSLSLLAGCAPGLELSVDLRSDLRAGDEVDEAVVSWERSGQELGSETVPLGAGADLVRGVRLADLAGLSAGVHRVRVTLRRAGEEVAQRSRSFQLDGDLAVTVVITRSCRDDGCEPPGCASAADCVREVDCLRAECLGGYCLTPPDDSRCGGGRCDPLVGCGPGVDAGPGPDDAGPIDFDAGPPPPGDAGPACPSGDCTDPSCDGLACDDGDPCTHTDRCGGGACGGTAITCDSEACVTRECNGTPTCTETVATDGTACTDDGNACTDDVCRGGSCAHDARADGTSLGGFSRCCGGAAVDISTSRAHCGGCGLACAGSFGCVLYEGRPACDCTANTDCQGGVGWLCSTTYDLTCACTNDSGCPGTSRCLDIPGLNYCE